jgi:hypothetical protein
MTPEFLRHAIIIAGGAIGLLWTPAMIFAEEPQCAVPERFYAFEPQLTKTTKALAGGRSVVIPVLGGASTVGLAAGKPDLAWPARLAAALEARFPSARTRVVNLAMTRQTAKRAAERLDRDVLPLKPTLVIWETGTMEAVRGTQIEEFRKTIETGITEMRAAKAEVILMNMQFSRDTDAIIDFEPYLIAMSETADVNDVPLFRRHDIMRHWAESGVLDLRTREPDKSRHVAARLYDCIGRAMADFITRGIPTPRPAPNPDIGR